MNEATEAKKDRLINPINGEEVDEIIKEKEANQRGYLDFQFMLRYLEDENEFVKYFIINGKKIIVDISRPNLQYRKPLNLNYERVLQTEPEKKDNISSNSSSTATVCSVADGSSSCLSCSG